jgi:hypothetical protein
MGEEEAYSLIAYSYSKFVLLIFASYHVRLFFVMCIYFLTSDGLRDKEPGFDSRKGQDFFLPTVSKPALGPTQPPIQWLPGLFLQE